MGKLKIPQATRQGYIEIENGGVFNGERITSETRGGRVIEGGAISPTIMANNREIYRVEARYRIRKLTPLECLRLMGFDDEDYKKLKAIGMSDSQIYKQSGNSIVVNVLEKIFRGLI